MTCTTCNSEVTEGRRVRDTADQVAKPVKRNLIQIESLYTPYTLDTYSTFTMENDEAYIIEGYNNGDYDNVTRSAGYNYDDIEWTFHIDEYLQALANNLVILLNDNILDDVILSVKANGKPWDPKEYNFTTDEMALDVIVDQMKLDQYIEANAKDYAKNKIQSCDGFWWSGSENTTKLAYYMDKKHNDPLTGDYKSYSYYVDQMENVPAYEYIDHKLAVAK